MAYALANRLATDKKYTDITFPSLIPNYLQHSASFKNINLADDNKFIFERVEMKMKFKNKGQVIVQLYMDEHAIRLVSELECLSDCNIITIIFS